MAITELANGELAITGYTELNNNVPQALLLRTEANGDLISFEDVQGADYGTDILEAIDGGFVLAGYTTNQDAIAIKLSETGGIEEINAYGGDFLDAFYSVTYAHDKQGYLFAGTNEVSNSSTQAYMVRTDLQGDTIAIGWEKTFGKNLPLHTASYNASVTTFDGGYFAVGASKKAFGFNQSFYLTKTSDEGDVYSNYVKGRVFYDLDNSNDFSSGDEPIEGWVVEATSNKPTAFGTSHSDGNYTVLVDTGTYNIKVRQPNEYWTSISLSQLNFTNPCDTFYLDFPIQVSNPCPDMEVDIATAALSPGGNANYMLTLCNDGSTTATEPYVDVDFDEAFTILEASEDFIILSSGILRFEELEDLAPLDCIKIEIKTILDAGLVEGETHCVKAHAYPDVFCNTNWNEASLEVTAECVGDEVKFSIVNNGGQISAASDFIIVEDMVMLSTPLPPVGIGEEYIVPKTANGATYRLIVPQEPGHPGDSRPSVAIEGCVAGGGTFSTGFVNFFDEDDYDHFLSVDCQENTLAVVPNESRGYPKGYDSNHEISNCIDLKYIHRFQNTGPDTAIRVVIQDTLSPLLDPATVRPGASSHNYSMEVYGNGILKFTFENILLPNSSTDPDGSQVFVKYRVSQKPDNPAGAILHNSAAIYFDYHAPVKTDSIYHTIKGCDLESFVMVSNTEIHWPGIEDIRVYPNPFHNRATLEIIGNVTLLQTEMVIRDLQGRVVQRTPFQGNTYQFERHQLAAGMYLYQILSQGQPVSSGKLIMQ